MPEENGKDKVTSEQPPVQQEVDLLSFNVPKIDNKKLARELRAQPIDFGPVRKRFKSWFFSTFKFTYNDNPEIGNSRITNITLSPGPEAIYDVPDGANLFLYINEFPGETKRDEFMTFLSLYQPVFKMLALEERARIFADDSPDQQEKFADWEARSILLEIIRLKDPYKINFSKNIQQRMDRLPQNVQEPRHIREDRTVWGKKRPGIGMLFTNNIVAQEHPEYDIPYLDELLCYNDGMFFNILISISRKIPKLWGLWVTAHHKILADTQSETHKLFCAIFSIPGGELFEEDGSIRQEAWLVIPEDIFEGLVIVERTRQEKIQSQKSIQERASRVQNILNNPGEIHFSKKDDSLILGELPTEVTGIVVTIKRNNKVFLRGTITRPQKGTVPLSSMPFQDLQNNQQIAWGSAKEKFKPKDIFSVHITYVIDGKSGTEKQIFQEKIPTPEREFRIEIPQSIPQGSGVKAQIIMPSPPTIIIPKIVPVPPAPELEKDPKEKEKADLETALELFFEDKKGELSAIFTNSAQWDERTQILTISLPIDSLEEYGYTPELLEPVEYLSLLQWSAQFEGEKWKMSQETPETIKTVIPEIHAHILKVKRGEQEKSREQQIDKKLEELGLPVSRKRSSEKLRGELVHILQRGQIKTEKLQAKILESGVREKGFRFYCNDKSITLAEIGEEISSNKWSVVYTWANDTWKITGIEKDTTFQERIKNAILRFLVGINEENIDDILIERMETKYHEKLENGLKERLEKGQASLFIRFRGQAIFIPDVSAENYQKKIQEVRTIYGEDTSIFVVYRTYSYAFYDGEFRTGQDETYDRCIENHLELIQARCFATLAQKSSFKENASTQESATMQERDAFTNGVTNLCREFFFKKNPFNTEDMGEFIVHIHREGTEKEKQEVLYSGVREALFGNNETGIINPSICRTFFFKKDPNNLDDVADFLCFLQERGTNEKERPGEKHVGIVYNSPIIGSISDIPKILAKKRKEKRRN